MTIFCPFIFSLESEQVVVMPDVEKDQQSHEFLIYAEIFDFVCFILLQSYI